jgi:hypothetical protein
MELLPLGIDQLSHQLLSINLAASEPLFLFMSVLRNALSGITTSPFATTIRSIGYVIAVASVAFMAYEVFFKGADPQDVAVGFFKFMLAILLVTQFDNFFTFILNGVEQIATSVVSSSSGFARTFERLRSLDGGLSSILNALGSAFSTGMAFVLLAFAQIVAIFAFQIFTTVYLLYGVLLYVTGPGFLGLLPSRGGGRYGLLYITNLVSFSLWPIIYALFDRFYTFATDSLSAPLLGRDPSLDRVIVYWSLMSVLLGLLIAFIPLVASSLLRGHGSLGGFLAGLAVAWAPGARRLARLFKGQGSTTQTQGGGGSGGSSGSRTGGTSAGGGSSSSTANQQATPPRASARPPAAAGAQSHGGSIAVPNRSRSQTP